MVNTTVPSDALEVSKLFIFVLFSLTDWHFVGLVYLFFFATCYLVATQPTLLVNHHGPGK